jgi:DNA invertase Pin-like site-specific DNA recombinase
MLNVLGGAAEFEREMILERQREGIAKVAKLPRVSGMGSATDLDISRANSGYDPLRTLDVTLPPSIR